VTVTSPAASVVSGDTTNAARATLDHNRHGKRPDVLQDAPVAGTRADAHGYGVDRLHTRRLRSRSGASAEPPSEPSAAGRLRCRRSSGELEAAVEAEAIVSASERTYKNAATRVIGGRLPDHGSSGSVDIHGVVAASVLAAVRPFS
jgi:hypothetical protein